MGMPTPISGIPGLRKEPSGREGEGKGHDECPRLGGARGGTAKAKADLGTRLSKGVWTWPEIKVSGYRWGIAHPKAGGGHLVASNPKQEEKKPPSRGAQGGQDRPLGVWKT